MLTQLQEKSAASKDTRTWSDVITKYPQVRQQLYSSRKLFMLSAEGASNQMPYHQSLVRLSRRTWSQEDSVTLLNLIINFLNDDFGEEKGATP